MVGVWVNLDFMIFGGTGCGLLRCFWGHLMILPRAFGPGGMSNVPQSAVGGLLFVPPNYVMDEGRSWEALLIFLLRGFCVNLSVIVFFDWDYD